MANQKFEELTARLLERITGEEAVHVNVMIACEEYFQFWTDEVFPPLRSAGKNPYRVLAECLVTAGYKNATEGMVRTYFNRIRKKRGLTEDGQRVVPSQVAQTASPPSHPQLKIGAPVTVSNSPAVVSKPVVSEPVAPIQAQELDVEFIKTHLSRLRNTKNDPSPVWTQDDEKLWSVFASIVKAAYCDLRNTSESKTALSKAKSVYPEMYELLKMKKLRLGLPME